MTEKIPERCFQCKHCGYDNHLEYYPYYYCKANGQEIHFNHVNGYDRMIWCPLLKEENDEQQE